MALKSDLWIKKMAKEYSMIEPFEQTQIRNSVISYGLSSYGYDMRISDEFSIYIPEKKSIIDPKNLKQEYFRVIKAREFILPSNKFVLAKSVEYFRIPRNILALCFGKSTYARCGVVVNVTPFEPEWEGYATISISNTSGSEVKIYAGEGIAQVIFIESDSVCEISYRDRKGKYQNQKNITFAKVEKYYEK